AAVPLVTTLLQIRQTYAALATAALGWFWAWRGSPPRSDSAFHSILLGGWALVTAGMIAEPLGGGIRKDSPTFSYYLVPAGLALLAWGVLSLRQMDSKTGRPGFLSLVGQNPLLAYAAITNLNWALWRLIGVESWIGSQGWTPWVLAGWALVQTLFIGAVAAGFSRLRWFCRA
ncbi:MAG: hypothetical protein MH204_00440, partial [Fimbriimonadaceae bacterium]|nr:hypothetical protein [Fimbriimonadaceae bacterium]